MKKSELKHMIKEIIVSESVVSDIKDNLFADKVSKMRDGAYKAFWGFYYTHGATAENYENKVKKAYSNAKIIDSGQVWKPFRGGASTESQSHFWVIFRLD